MKELSNQISGSICRIFEENKVSLGVSVPLCVSGFYEVYSDYTEKQTPLDKFGAAWGITGPFGDLHCTSYIEISQNEQLTNISFDPESNNPLLDEEEEEDDDDDDVEFL